MKEPDTGHPYDDEGNLTWDYWEWWVSEQGAMVSQPLGVLVEKGAGREELLSKLKPLLPSALKTAISKTDLKGILRRIQKAQIDVMWLQASDIRAIVFNDPPRRPRRFTNLSSELSQLETLLKGLLASKTVTKKRSITLDEAVAELARYVEASTGSFHDEEVSQLITAVTGREMTAAALKQWRSRQKQIR